MEYIYNKTKYLIFIFYKLAELITIGILRGCLIPAKFSAVPATMFSIKY